MGVTLTNQQVLDGIGAVEVLQQGSGKALFKLKCARVLAKLRDEGQRVLDQVEKLKDEHMVKDAEGKPVPREVGGRVIEGSITFKDDKAFSAAYRELLEAPLGYELEIPVFTESELEAIEVSGSLEGLLPLVTG